MNYEFSLSFVLYFILSSIGGLFLLIVLFKYFLRGKRNEENNIFSYRRPFLLVGFLLSILVIFVVFNVTSLESKEPVIVETPNIDIIEIDIPRTISPPKKKLPKPPPVLIEEVPEDISEEQPDYLSIDINPDQDEYMYEEDSTTAIPEFIPPPINDNDDYTFDVVEIMPRFPGCEDMNTNPEREKCAQEKMLQYIYSNLEYPVIARETGIQGRVVIRFVVSKTGTIRSVEILRDIGGGCGEAAVEVIKNMNNLPEKWIPGRQGGRRVSVFYTLPVVFKLR